MRKIYKYLLCALVMASIISCGNNTGNTPEIPEGEGRLSLDLAFTKSQANTQSGFTEEQIAEILENSTAKIYKEVDGSFGNGGLIQKYSPATTMPSDINLLAGKYKIVLEAGAGENASFKLSDRSYYGEKEFTLVSQEVTFIDLECLTENSIVKVEFDQTIAEKFDISALCYVSTRNTFDLAAAEAGTVPTLKYESDSTGYFLLPFGVQNISWGFYGKSSKEDLTVEGGALDIQVDGTIKAPEAATQYTLQFKYTKTPNGDADITVKFDESVEIIENGLSFSPQPSISGVGFNVSEVNSYIGNEFVFEISSLNDLQSIEVSTKVLDGDDVSTQFVPFENSTVVNINSSGVIYTPNPTNPKKGTLTLGTAFFEKYNSGGEKDITIRAYDVNLTRGQADMVTKVSGVMPEVDDLDLWDNKATFKACVTRTSATSVNILYRKSGDVAWTELSTTDAGNGFYQATVLPDWKESKNEAGLTVYTLTSGITAGTTYEYKLSVDGVDLPNSLTLVTEGEQIIPYGDMESDALTCWGKSNGGSSNWGSGNNTFTSGLCKQGSDDVMGSNNKYANLQAGETLGNLAAGNLFLGQFAMDGMSGTVTFGQPFSWTSRPTKFAFNYKSTIGVVDIQKKDGLGLEKGDLDISRIYFAIVDWGSRHSVTAGTSGASGVWDPATQIETGEGKIIGYASLKITQSTNSMTSQELTVYYYDKETKPSKTYTILISCATSNYGDYMVGSSDSNLKVDNFKLLY